MKRVALVILMLLMSGCSTLSSMGEKSNCKATIEFECDCDCKKDGVVKSISENIL